MGGGTEVKQKSNWVGERKKDRRVRKTRESIKTGRQEITQSWYNGLVNNLSKIVCVFSTAMGVNMKKSDLCEEPFLGAARLDALWSQCIHLHSLTNSPASFHRNPTLMESNSCHRIEKKSLASPLTQLFDHPTIPLILC